MKFLVAGASGFLGTQLTRRLTDEGHVVTRLVRGPAESGESRWDPYTGRVDLDLVEASDVVVNLAGAPLVRWPWTESYTRTFTESRVRTTRTLADAIAGSRSKPVFLAQNGIAGYGDRGADVVTEDDPLVATSPLGRVTRPWQEATRPAGEAGARVVVMRTAVVLDRRGGALRTMMLPFRIGLGGQVGNGAQYFATISLEDWLRAVLHLVDSDSASGAYNLTGPDTVTNAEFTRALASALHRPALLRVPAWPVRRVLGPLATELLGSIRLEPKRLLDEGFDFRHPTVEARLQAALNP
jgi:uncharacterized protein (TIGR01777 family)